MSKACTSCGLRQPLDRFNSDRSHSDGKASRCKSCVVVQNKIRRAAHLEDELIRRRKWRKTERAKKLIYEQQLRRRARDPIKTAAYRAISNGLRDGKVFRQPCEVCGDTKVHAHHTDYSKPLEVQWLCEKHHLHAHHRVKIVIRDVASQADANKFSVAP